SIAPIVLTGDTHRTSGIEPLRAGTVSAWRRSRRARGVSTGRRPSARRRTRARPGRAPPPRPGRMCSASTPRWLPPVPTAPAAPRGADASAGAVARGGRTRRAGADPTTGRDGSSIIGEGRSGTPGGDVAGRTGSSTGALALHGSAGSDRGGSLVVGSVTAGGGPSALDRIEADGAGARRALVAHGETPRSPLSWRTRGMQ